MTYDGASSYLLLFGGTTPSGQTLNDTWEYDGTSWTELQPAQSPPPLSGASMAYDASLGQLLLFGGSTPVSRTLTPTDQTWAWNGASWQLQNPATSPPARSGASLASFDGATGGSFLLFGGMGAPQTVVSSASTTASPTDPTTELPTASTTTRSVVTTSAVSTAAKSSVATLDDTWTWNGVTWTQEAPSVTDPPARVDAAAAWDPALQQVVLFGGSSDGTTTAGSLLGDQWAWNGQGWSQLRPKAVPTARSGATLTNDPETGGDILVDGWTADGPTAQVWQYISGSWQSIAGTAPTARADATAGWDSATAQLVMFGGAGTNGAVDDETYVLGAPVVTPVTTTTTTTTVAPSPTTVPAGHRPAAATSTTTSPPSRTIPLSPSTTPTTPPAVAITQPATKLPAIVALTPQNSSVSSGSATAPIAASRTTSHAGQQVVVTGTGYAPRARVAIWFHSTPVLLGNATANAAGQFNLEVTIPADAAPGAHHFVAEGLYASGKVEAFTIALHVTLPPPPGQSRTESVVLILVTLAIPGATWAALALAARRRKRVTLST